MRYVIDVGVNFGRSWGGLWAAQIYLIWAVGLVLSYIRYLILSYLILSYLILNILDIFVILGYLRPRWSGQVPRSGANRSPKGIPPKRPQEQPKRPQDTLRDRFLEPFWMIFLDFLSKFNFI